jgi:lambda family phage minor tail protein L
MSLSEEAQKLSPAALVELFELDLRARGGEVLRFHAGVNALGRDVVWQGSPYIRLPIEAEGFERRGQGALPRPRLRVANIGGLLGAEARAFDDFVGCRLVRKRTFARFLDAVNFAEGNPEADPHQHFPDEIWCVDRKAAENAVYS